MEEIYVWTILAFYEIALRLAPSFLQAVRQPALLRIAFLPDWYIEPYNPSSFSSRQVLFLKIGKNIQ